MNKNTCCFTGHRNLPRQNIEEIRMRLRKEMESLIDNGVTNFVAGGAMGFDQMAAECVLAKKRKAIRYDWYWRFRIGGTTNDGPIAKGSRINLSLIMQMKSYISLSNTIKNA